VSGGCGEPPYKGFAPLRQVPGCHDPKYILLDFLHIYHIGYGLDSAASAVVLLCNLGQFGNARKLDDRLAEAFGRFDSWCKRNKKTTSIDEFSKNGFGMGKRLGTYQFNTFMVSILTSPLVYILLSDAPCTIACPGKTVSRRH